MSISIKKCVLRTFLTRFLKRLTLSSSGTSKTVKKKNTKLSTTTTCHHLGGNDVVTMW